MRRILKTFLCSALRLPRCEPGRVTEYPDEGHEFIFHTNLNDHARSGEAYDRVEGGVLAAYSGMETE